MIIFDDFEDDMLSEYKYFVLHKVFSQRMNDWLDQNLCLNDCIISGNGYSFKNKEDAVAFELTWG